MDKISKNLTSRLKYGIQLSAFGLLFLRNSSSENENSETFNIQGFYQVKDCPNLSRNESREYSAINGVNAYIQAKNDGLIDEGTFVESGAYQFDYANEASKRILNPEEIYTKILI